MPRSHPSAHATPPAVRCVDRRGVHTFGVPLRVVRAARLEEVVPTLAEVERETAAGRFAAGFVAYEAAPAFDAALAVHAASALPLAWFAIYADPPADGNLSGEAPLEVAHPEWESACSESHYREAIDRIHALIAAGDTYQVNFTFPMRAHFDGDAAALFDALICAQPTDYGCFIDAGDFAILSVSPELFFRLDGESICCRPMKGTAARGLASADEIGRASCRERV